MVDIPVLTEHAHTMRVSTIDTRALGLLLIEMGAGRRKKEDAIDHKVGIVHMKKVGESVDKNEPVCFLRLRKNDPNAVKHTQAAAAAFRLADAQTRIQTQPIVAEWIK
jgi:thymidine phosphorylase